MHTLLKALVFVYLHRLLQYSIVKVAHEHAKETNDESEPFVLQKRRFALPLAGGHAIVKQSWYGHGHRSAPRTPRSCVPIHSTGDQRPKRLRDSS